MQRGISSIFRATLPPLSESETCALHFAGRRSRYSHYRLRRQVSKTTYLEQKLQRELNLPWCVLRASDPTESRITSRERLAISGVGSPQTHVVEEIVELAPELEDFILTMQGEVLE